MDESRVGKGSSENPDPSPPRSRSGHRTLSSDPTPDRVLLLEEREDVSHTASSVSVETPQTLPPCYQSTRSWSLWRQ